MWLSLVSAKIFDEMECLAWISPRKIFKGISNNCWWSEVSHNYDMLFLLYWFLSENQSVQECIQKEFTTQWQPITRNESASLIRRANPRIWLGSFASQSRAIWSNFPITFFHGQYLQNLWSFLLSNSSKDELIARSLPEYWAICAGNHTWTGVSSSCELSICLVELVKHPVPLRKLTSTECWSIIQLNQFHSVLYHPNRIIHTICMDTSASKKIKFQELTKSSILPRWNICKGFGCQYFIFTSGMATLSQII